MTLGGDTGFLVRVIEGFSDAASFWEQVTTGASDLVLSCLSINELLTHYYKRGRGDEAKEMIALIAALGNGWFVAADRAIAERSAGYRYSLGIPTVDSVILATFVEAGCDLMLTTDPHMQRADPQGIVKVLLLS